MDIFKLFFNHDQRLDKLAKRNANKSKKEIEASLEDFMKPEPTYSKFYITGTRLEDENFGINTLEKSEELLQAFDDLFSKKSVYTEEGQFSKISGAIKSMDIGDLLILSDSKSRKYSFDKLKIDEESNVGHKKEELSEILKSGDIVIYKEQAHHGYDLHMFSLENIYPDLFKAFKALVDDQFRFFSINSKRMGSERHFYFETWTLDRPPHGAEEVMPDTVL